MRVIGIAVLAGLFIFGIVFATKSGQVQSARSAAPPAESGELQGQESTKPEVTGTQLRDFNSRCHADGVVVCQGFDSPLINIAAQWPAAGLYPAGDNAIHGKFDRSEKASGEGSLRFEILSHTGQNAAGYWRQPFGRNFGAGSTFYVQFRQRFSPEMLSNNWGDTTWKQVIFHNDGQTCTDLGITTVQYYHAGFPMMYTECGARMVATNNGNPPYLLQQGDYNCWYGRYNPKDCFMYPTNEWVTFYYQVSVGHWDKADSTINAWVARDGRPYRQWIKMPAFRLRNAHPGNDYDSLTLLTYMTNKSASLDHPTAYAWYDELIVSSQPIAPPTASGGSN